MIRLIASVRLSEMVGQDVKVNAAFFELRNEGAKHGFNILRSPHLEHTATDRSQSVLLGSFLLKLLEVVESRYPDGKYITYFAKQVLVVAGECVDLCASH